VGDVHPLVIFFDWTDREQAKATLAAHPNTAKFDLEDQLDQAALRKLQYRHVFTHVIQLGTDLKDTIAKATAIIAKEYKGDFWAVVPQALPRTVRCCVC
jgi:hypothetical protein